MARIRKINPLIDAATRRSAATQIQAHHRGAGNAGGLHAQLYERQLPGRAFRISQPAPAAGRIPVSETGYRSHFAPMPDIEAEASPQEYARLVALAFIRRAPAPTIRDEDYEQPSLFSLLDR